MYKKLRIWMLSLCLSLTMAVSAFALTPAEEADAVTKVIPTAYGFTLGMDMLEYQPAYDNLEGWTQAASDFAPEAPFGSAVTTFVRTYDAPAAVREEFTISHNEKTVDFYSFRFLTNDQQTALDIYNTALTNIKKKLGRKDRNASSGNTDGWYYKDGKYAIKLQATINRINGDGRYMVVVSRVINN